METNVEKQSTTDVWSPKRAVIFARTRSVPQDARLDQTQVTAQLAACRAVAARLGAQIVGEHWAIDGAGGQGTRIVVDAMLEEIAECEPDYLIVQSYDRLARRSEELAGIVRRLAEAGVTLTTSADPGKAFLADHALIQVLTTASERRSA